MPELTNWMLKLSKEANGSTDSWVFAMREVLTAAYRQGFEDGHMAADRDDFVCSVIDKQKAKEQVDDAS